MEMRVASITWPFHPIEWVLNRFAQKSDVSLLPIQPSVSAMVHLCVHMLVRHSIVWWMMRLLLCSLQPCMLFLLTYPWFSNSQGFFSLSCDHFCSPPEISLSTYVSSFVCTFPSSCAFLPFSLALRWCSAVFGYMRLQTQTTRCRIMYSSINFPFRLFFSVKKKIHI